MDNNLMPLVSELMASLQSGDEENFDFALNLLNQRRGLGEGIRFFIEGKPIPKARPRVTSNGVFYPESYRNWTQHAELEIWSQLQDLGIKEPFERCAIAFILHGKSRGDGDNLIGGCLDPAKKAGLIKDDNITRIPEFSFRCDRASKKQGMEMIVFPQPETPKTKRKSKCKSI
jgi:Holliday junction resolvase RusA-like endonuclease